MKLVYFLSLAVTKRWTSASIRVFSASCVEEAPLVPLAVDGGTYHLLKRVLPWRFCNKKKRIYFDHKKRNAWMRTPRFFFCFLGMDPTMPYIQEAKLLFLTIIVLMKEDVTNVWGLSKSSNSYLLVNKQKWSNMKGVRNPFLASTMTTTPRKNHPKKKQTNHAPNSPYGVCSIEFT